MMDLNGPVLAVIALPYVGATVALVALLVWVAVRVARLAWNGGGPPRPPIDPALQILRERYARGEISLEEFEERRRQLGL